MTKQTEAMKLALKALESVLCDPEGNVCWQGSYADRDIIGDALDVFRTAFREALAEQPAQQASGTEWLVCPKCAHQSPYTAVKAKTLAEEAELITKQARAALVQMKEKK